MYLVEKYLLLLSSSLPRFVRKNQWSWNFRCPICGDSKTSQTKARGYILIKNDKAKYYCHNCHLILRFDQFLQQVDQNLYEQYKLEDIADRYTNNRKIIKGSAAELAAKMKVKPYKKGILSSLKSVSQLAVNHPCKQYVINRKIPPRWHHQLYYCDRFIELVNSAIPNKYDLEKVKEHERLIIPLISRSGTQLIGFQGRILPGCEDKAKYITTMLLEQPRAFNLNTVNFNIPYICTEGPIDAMYFSNAIASCGGSITAIVEQLGVAKHNAIICYDNQPRNKDVVRLIARAIQKGFSVFIWPESMAERKDFGSLIESGFSPTAMESLVTQNTFHGLKAQLMFTTWKKVELE